MGIFRTLTNLLVRGRAQSKPATLGEVLADSTNLHFFAQYAAAAGRCDLLIMWIECQQYASANARLLRRHKARGLVRAYFGEGGVLDEMGLSDVRVEIITTHCLSAAELSPALFEPLQRALERELQHDVLPGFLASELNRRMVAAEGDFSAVLSIDDFDLLSFLGAGGFGMVLLARRKQTGRLYALKLLDKRTLLSRKHVFSVFREKAALAHVSHPFIVSLKFALESEDLLGFVCDYAPGGNLYASVSDLGPCPLERARVYAAQMVLALSQVHDMGILYRDLKPDNVLIDTDGHCRLADMGAARGEQAGGEIGAGGSYRNKTLRKSELCESAADSDLERALAEVGAASLDDETADADSASSHPRKGVSTRMTISGTHGYRAPEVYARAYGKGVDWWDLGLLLLEMLTGSNPYRGHTRADSEYLAKHEQVETPAWFDAQTTSIVQAFLARDPARRLGCTEEGVGAILAHPFFESIDWDELIDIDARRDAAQSAHEAALLAKWDTVVPAPGTNSYEYYCKRVDYLRKGLAQRAAVTLSRDDQEAFRGFAFVSLEAIREDLLIARGPGGRLTAGGISRSVQLELNRARSRPKPAESTTERLAASLARSFSRRGKAEQRRHTSPLMRS